MRAVVIESIGSAWITEGESWGGQSGSRNFLSSCEMQRNDTNAIIHSAGPSELCNIKKLNLTLWASYLLPYSVYVLPFAKHAQFNLFLNFFLCVKSLHHCFGAGTHVCCSLSTASENLPQTATFKAGSCAASCWLNLNLINCGIFTALSVTLSRLILFLLHETKLTERWEDWRQILSTVWVWSHICLVHGAFGFCGGVLCSHSKCPQLELKSCSPPSRCTDASLPCWNGLCCSIAISQDCPQTDSLFLHPNPPTCHLLHLLTACLIPLLSPPTNNT